VSNHDPYSDRLPWRTRDRRHRHCVILSGKLLRKFLSLSEEQFPPVEMQRPLR
jgi:hypothetical protein